MHLVWVEGKGEIKTNSQVSDLSSHGNGGAIDRDKADGVAAGRFKNSVLEELSLRLASGDGK